MDRPESPIPSAPPKLARLAFAKLRPLSSPPPPLPPLERGVKAPHFGHMLPAKIDPQPISSPSQLRAESPAFVPQHQQLRTSTTLHARGGDNYTMRSAVPGRVSNSLQADEIDDRIQQITSMASAVRRQQVNEPYNGFDTHLRHGPHRDPPISLEARLARLPRVYYKRADRSRKDIIIIDKGAICNVFKVTERFLPDGSPYHDYWPMFEGPNCSFIAAFRSISTYEQHEFLKDKEVEVIVKLTTNDDEEKPEYLSKKKKNNGNKKNKYKNKEGGASTATADIDGGYMEEFQGAAEGGSYFDAKWSEQDADPYTMEYKPLGSKGRDAEVEGFCHFGAANAKAPTVIDTINALGPNFAKNTTSLWITIDFTEIASPMDSGVPITNGPRGTVWVNGKDPVTFGPNFTFITELVKALQVFTELKQMRINLRVRESSVGFPFTLQQFALVLPFYDLDFLDWTISYQNEKLTATVPIRDNEFPMQWLERKRNKILRAREKSNRRRQRGEYGMASLADFLKASSR